LRSQRVASPWGPTSARTLRTDGPSWYVLAFAVLLRINAAAQRSEQLAVALLFGFGLLPGLAIAPTIAYYVGADPRAVFSGGDE
jgi:hypothetical protein